MPLITLANLFVHEKYLSLKVKFLWFVEISKGDKLGESRNEFSGLSRNILHVGNKSSMQRGFFKNGMGSLLPTLAFLGIYIRIYILNIYIYNINIPYRFGNDPILSKNV